ncbi:hypothetical protein ACFVVM_14100 [Nocardia sp. NPDC058176]|uniref:hypothetical protein n=1 Tax=Nocardia sp. NPDC058176 TaxID=3346368 RepID=UPI0036DCFB6F
MKASATPLGDGSGLRNAARHAATGGEPVSMMDVTRAAGLKDDWDQIIVVFPGTKADALNKDGGISAVCWENLPGPYGDDTPHAAYYLFVREQKPVQAVHWFYPNDRDLDFMTSRTKIVKPDTLLAPVHAPGSDPFLRPVK